MTPKIKKITQQRSRTLPAPFPNIAAIKLNTPNNAQSQFKASQMPLAPTIFKSMCKEVGINKANVKKAVTNPQRNITTRHSSISGRLLPIHTAQAKYKLTPAGKKKSTTKTKRLSSLLIVIRDAALNSRWLGSPKILPDCFHIPTRIRTRRVSCAYLHLARQIIEKYRQHHARNEKQPGFAQLVPSALTKFART